MKITINFGLITIGLILLKLTGLINWSWWWVLILVWPPLFLALFVIGILAIFLLIVVFWCIYKEIVS